MNNKQVAHLWANKSRPSAKGSHFYFEGDTIYSYGSHFPIARHYKGVVLFTAQSHSVTTAKHKGYVRSAMTHLKSFTIPDIKGNPCGEHVKHYASEIDDLSLQCARTKDATWKLTQLKSLVDEANEFCAMFKFKTRFAMPENLDALKAKAKEQSAKKAKATAARNAKIECDNAIAIEKWIAGEQTSLGYEIQKVYLRAKTTYNPENSSALGSQMQTSKGAIVPLSEAQKAFRFVMLKRATGWHRNGDKFQVGEFQLEAVNGQGVVAGCHRITWDEIERFAKTQNWI